MTDTERLRHLEAENAALAARAARAEAIAAHAEASAAAQAMRAHAWTWQARQLQKQAATMRRSLFWRLTLPLRLAVVVARGVPANTAEGAVLRRAYGLARQQGVLQAARLGRAWWRRQNRPRREVTGVPAVAQGESGGIALAQSVLIVAELTVAQCAKYRVWQKQEMLALLGVPCRVVDWRDTELCFSAAATATQAILYRVPATPEMLALIDTLRALGVAPAWEVDDLIFDELLYRQNSNLADLAPDLRRNVLEGVVLYRRALLACGRGIASTSHLAQAMRDAGVADVTVVENALDAETLALADAIRATRSARTAGPGVLITYGSGTKTHDADFRQAAPALLRLLRAHPACRLRVIGELTLPDDFAIVSAQIEQVPPVPYARYLSLLGETDISLAPLEPTLFNDAKSNIKFLEAAVLGVPSVCSPRAQFAAVMRHGENGLLAENESGWFEALSALVADAALRARLGAAALGDALARYAPEAVAWEQLAPVVQPAAARAPGVLRVLMANVFYAPRSFGGATIVVEEMVRRLRAMPGTEIMVVTTADDEDADGGADKAWRSMTRSQTDGVTVWALPSCEGDSIAAFDDPALGDGFGRVLDAARPDVVHLHSVQRLSGSIATACRVRGIPYVITLHDAWWLCERQFMVRADGRYCFQTRIDLHVCEACVPGARHLGHRLALLRDALDGAALLLAPSQAHRQLYLAQGIDPDRIVVAPNGVRLPPAAVAPRAPGARLRFGYVGGHEIVKGYGLVKEAFEALARDDWELVLVDNTLNLGYSSVDVSAWSVRGQVRMVPAYGQDTMEGFFAGIDVLLFPSQWKESFGLTVREALARDVWVISTDGGGPADAIEDGVNGTLIALDGRAETLQAAIETVLDRPGRLRGFVNPHKAAIIDYDTQAASLRALLAQVADATLAKRADRADRTDRAA